ncbi:MAG TPA: hypothetical protein DDZ90_00275, partial [Planctomycetaceae bacterium]|nr:hypothetical protein [Planctomycetaceae bacterium]
FGTAGQAGPWHTKTSLLVAISPIGSDVRVPPSACPTVLLQTPRNLPKRVAPNLFLVPGTFILIKKYFNSINLVGDTE